MRSARAAAWTGAALLALLAAAPAFAQGVSQKAVAESLFQQGRKAMAAGRVDEACKSFEESQRLVPKLGTLLNLATCHEEQGRTASAWAEFTEASTRAAREGQPDREAYARERLVKLEPKLSRLVVSVPHPEDDLSVFVGDAPLGRGTWGTALPVDPGQTTVRAERAGAATWRTVIEIPPGPATIRVAVPELAGTAASGPPAPTAGTRATNRAPADAPRDDGVQRGLGWAAVGVGAVAVGLGGYFGVRTFQLRDDSSPHCHGELCDATGVDLRESAHDTALASTLLFGLGAAAAVGGVVLLLTAESAADGAAAARAFVGAPAFRF